MTVFKGDNTGAFGNNFITIELDNPLGYIISKAEFVCGCYKKPIPNPQFPLVINFTEEETKKLNFKNTCYLVVWDELGRQKTCEGTITFTAKNGVL